MKKCLLCLIVILSLFLGAAKENNFKDIQYPLVQKLGELSVVKPAFLSVETLEEENPQALVISSFGKGKVDAINMVLDIGNAIKNLSAAKPELMSKNVVWPNEAKAVPHEALNRDALLVASGFLVPGKTGTITLFDIPTAQPVPAVKLTKDKFGWFYHHALWRDMNGDGKLDIVTARAAVGIAAPAATGESMVVKLLQDEPDAIFPLIPIDFGKPKGQLIWLEQPLETPFQSKWKEHLITEGPDVNFELADLDGDGKEEILATQFFTKKLSVFWNEGSELKSRVVDDTLGSAFDLQLVDLNQDGNKDLLVTNHEPDSKAAVFAYEIPTDFKTDPWKRKTLLSGIETRQEGRNQGSPGTAIAFHPDGNTLRKPLIIVSGDGSQRVHLLTPASPGKNDWTYKESILLDTKSSAIGKIAVEDVDGDGFVELFIPAYHADKIYVMTFAS